MAAKRQPKINPAVPEPLQLFGLKEIPGWTQIDYERYAFARRWPVDKGAPLRLDLYRRITNHMYPGHLEWHEWTEKVANALCGGPSDTIMGNKTVIMVGFPGCSNSAKTFNVVNFAVNWWLCAPAESSVTLVSTSKQSLRRRGWAEVTKCYTSLDKGRERFGNFVDSRMLWQCIKGDDKHAIIGKAVEEGPVHKVADDIKGVHTKRQMVIIDEATSVPAAIYDACANLYSYPDEFILVLIGNPLNRLDQFGRFCEPEGGWTSVSVETGEWFAKAQEAIGGCRPHIVTFDATKSPNIVEGKLVSRHLPTKEMVEAAVKASGGGQTPLFWQNMRGFWPPEGLTKTVFSQSMLERARAFDRHQFTGRNFQIIGAFDPAFGGGDRPALRFAKMGELADGKWGIQALPPVIIPINATSSNPVHFQLAEQVQRQCESFVDNGTEYSCPPENLAVDATGEGGGLCDIMSRTWSPDIIRVEFGGKASEDSASLEDIRPANEVYENKVVEMWFRSRDAVNSGQLKGVDVDTSTELCSRMFDDSGRRIKLQKKKDYRDIFKKSPDLADSFCILSEVARIRGFRLAAMGQTVNRAQRWDESVTKTQEVYDEKEVYAGEEIDEEMYA